MYGDPACTDLNASATTLTNALPLSYGVASPQYPFWGFIMTRNLTGAEVLSFYSSTNESSDACGELVWAVNATDGGAGFCVPRTAGAGIVVRGESRYSKVVTVGVAIDGVGEGVVDGGGDEDDFAGVVDLEVTVCKVVIACEVDGVYVMKSMVVEVVALELTVEDIELVDVVEAVALELAVEDTELVNGVEDNLEVVIVEVAEVVEVVALELVVEGMELVSGVEDNIEVVVAELAEDIEVVALELVVEGTELVNVADGALEEVLIVELTEVVEAVTLALVVEIVEVVIVELADVVELLNIIGDEAFDVTESVDKLTELESVDVAVEAVALDVDVKELLGLSL
ncbi:MAG: hypothetical protein ASARMPRED_000903 [Alectoria sarmentosa]|nr:MAG: hypothetical protein ASARMPRED_000903 [Alectoria sarmentosa]